MKIHNPIKIIAFDFFGVLCPPMYGGVLREIFPADETARREWMHMVEVELDRGDITEDEFVARLANAVGWDPQLIKRRSYEYGVLNQSLLSFIRELKKSGYQVGLLTNAPRSIIVTVLKEDFSLFDVPVISADIHLIKPQPEIFEHFVSKANVPADQIFFIDDNPKNIFAAQACGMNGAVFTDVETLKDTLIKSGVVI